MLDLLEDVADIQTDDPERGKHAAADDEQHKHQRAPTGFQGGLAPGEPEAENVDCFNQGEDEEQDADRNADIKRYQGKEKMAFMARFIILRVVYLDSPAIRSAGANSRMAVRKPVQATMPRRKR